MKADSVLFLLGISKKAGKLIAGQESVERAANAKKISLIIVSNDTSKNTKEKMKNLSNKTNIPILFWSQADELGKAIGKELSKVIGITDEGFAKEIQKRIKLLTGVGDIDEITRV